MRLDIRLGLKLKNNNTYRDIKSSCWRLQWHSYVGNNEKLTVAVSKKKRIIWIRSNTNISELKIFSFSKRFYLRVVKFTQKEENELSIQRSTSVTANWLKRISKVAFETNKLFQYTVLKIYSRSVNYMFVVRICKNFQQNKPC